MNWNGEKTAGAMVFLLVIYIGSYFLAQYFYAWDFSGTTFSFPRRSNAAGTFETECVGRMDTWFAPAKWVEWRLTGRQPIFHLAF